jgi:RNA polymerase sigma factor (sigma-70 family)
MANAAVHAVRRYLHSLRTEPALSDAELLAHFCAAREGEAFAELVRRHGPMVLGVGLRLLGNRADAEDLFQNVIIALARQACSIRGASIGAWLHRVTVRLAGRALARCRSTPVSDVPIPATDADPFADAAWREVRRLLDEELNRLPERLRAPLVLCYLEALTRDEAARRLGWPLRTLERRLHQARGVLHERLVRRGVTSAALAVAALASEGLRAEVPDTVAQATLQAALHVPRAAWALGAMSAPILIGATALLGLGAVVVIGLLSAAAPSAADPAQPKESKSTPAATARAEVPDVALPEGALRRFGALAWRQNGGISEGILSADGKTFVTVGQGSVAVWDTATGRRRHFFRSQDLPHFFEPGTATISPDSKHLVLLVRHGVEARLYDLATGEESRTFGQRPPAQPGANENGIDYRSIRFAPNGKELLLGDMKKVVVYDAADGKELRTFSIPGRIIADSADGKLLAVHGPEAIAVVAICDATTGKELRKLDGELIDPGANSWAIRAAFSADGSMLATLANFKPEVCVWETATGKKKGTFTRAKPKENDWGDDERLGAVGFSADGKTLLAGGFVVSGIRRWDLGTGKELPPLRGHTSTILSLIPAPSPADQGLAVWLMYRTMIHSLIPAPSPADLLYTCGNDSTIRRWDLNNGKEISPPEGYTDQAVAAYSPDGKFVVTADFTSRLLVWSAESGELLHTLPLKGEFSGPPMTFSPDGRTFAASQWNGVVALFDTSTWRVREEITLPKGDQPFIFISAIAFVAGGERLLVAEGCAALGLWDRMAKKFLWHEQQKTTALAVRPDGKAFAIATDKGVSIRDIQDGKQTLLIRIEPHPKSVTPFPIRVDCLAFSPDGRRLAASRWDDGDVYVWDAESGREIWRLKGHPEVNHMSVRMGHSAVAFSPDGRWLASGHNDATTRLWEMATGKEVLKLTGQDAHVTGVALGPAGRTLLVTAGVEVLVWGTRPKPDAKVDLNALWDDLASDDAPKAYRAMSSLAARGEKATELLAEHVKPVPVVEQALLAKLIANLDSERFAVRERASKELASRGAAAKGALKEALKQKLSTETQRRVRDLLSRLESPPSAGEVQQLRAVPVLEWAGSEVAMKALRTLAAGAPGAALTESARLSVREMEHASK